MCIEKAYAWRNDTPHYSGPQFWTRGRLFHPEKIELLYVGDGHNRENVEIVYQENKVDIVQDRWGGQQKFRWPDGSEDFAPPHCVVKDTNEVRAALGLPLKG